MSFFSSRVRFRFQVKVGDCLFPEALAPSKKAARQLAAEEAVKTLVAEGKLQLNKVLSSSCTVVLKNRSLFLDNFVVGK